MLSKLLISFLFLNLIFNASANPKFKKNIATPPGAEKSTKTQALAAGAWALQTDKPVDQMNIYLVGFHPMKDNPNHQMEAHHFCKQVNEDFAQCALFDGKSEKANLNGVEYIISEKLYEGLPEEEKKYWHPHNYEILSGQLIAPGIPTIAEKELMKSKMNSYGKTWHVWDTGRYGNKKVNQLPFGEPKLAWSFNRDGEAKAGLVEQRDKRFEVKTSKIKANRQEFVSIANPQGGVLDIADQFSGETKPIPGVAPKGKKAKKWLSE